jgi:hypothetical protein
MKELAQFIFYRTHHFSIFIDPLISRQLIEQWDFCRVVPAGLHSVLALTSMGIPFGFE